MEKEITRADLSDLEEILGLQKLAYRKEAERYNDFHIPPLAQTIEEIRGEYCDTLFLKLVADGRIVGSIKGKREGATCRVGRLMVHPGHRGRGYAKRLIAALEAEFQTTGGVERFELFTGEQSRDNIALYESMGYAIFRVEPFDEEKNLVYLEKTAASRTGP